MTLNQADRSNLIHYRLKQAKETIALVNFLMDNNQLILAANRIYYGMYYALTALAIHHRFETSKHAQIIGWFNKEFVSTNKVSVKHGASLKKAYMNRTKGDYDVFVTFEKEEIMLMKTELEYFIDVVEKLIIEQL